MSRVITAFVIIGVIMSYSAFAAWVINGENRELVSITEEIAVYNENGDTAKASAAAERLTEKWSRFEKNMSVFVRDDKLYTLSTSVSKVSPYISAANDELDAELENICRQLRLIYRSELPVWYNIL
ncbi:MAG: DUF4363 family protein [Oscillospiraceae bacterium]|nr:DUF4363 family protein [Oscillospiraceae bacterium]